jgi:formylglycine-generating enzyme required for sulfatase activity
MFVSILFFVALLSRPCHGQNTSINAIGMEFVRIDPGTMIVGRFEPPYPVPEDTVKGAQRPLVMWMGDGRMYNVEEFALAKQLATNDVMSGFEVSIPKPYFIGKYEVTQAQWSEVMGSNPSTFKELKDAQTHPVESVTWEDVQQFLERLNQRDSGRHHYRLPTEFEWEFAARAGATGDIPWSETQRVAQLGGVTTYAVGQKQPNAWGIYDMLGNVWEWVDDVYNEKLFADPTPPASGKVHVLKGASFVGDVKNATWLTHAGGPGNGWDVGFRVVMEVTENR